MSRAAARRGPDPIAAGSGTRAGTLGWQILWHAVTFESDEPTVLSGLTQLLACATYPIEASRAQHYAVAREATGYSVSEQGDLLAHTRSVGEARNIVYARSHRRAFELAALRGWTLMHGALVDLEQRRLLLVGRDGGDRAVACLRLALRGASFQGADSLLVREGQTLAIGRPLMLAAGVERDVPELAAVVPGLPRRQDVSILDPARDLDLPWRLRVGRVDDVVVLDDGREAVVCRPSEPAEVFDDVLRFAAATQEARSRLVTVLRVLLEQTRCHRLSVGNPSETEDALRRLAC